jgi:hypothetical protein
MMGFMIPPTSKRGKIDHPYGGGEFTEVAAKVLEKPVEVLEKPVEVLEIQSKCWKTCLTGFTDFYSWYTEFGWKCGRGFRHVLEIL